MSRESFLMYLSFEEPLKVLSADELRMMIDAIFAYHRDRTEPQFSDRAMSVVWMQLRTQFDRDREKWQSVCEQRSIAGMKGGRPSKANASSEKQKKQMLLRKAKKADTVSDTDTESVSENNTRENPESDFTLAAPAVANNVFSFTEFWEMYAFKVDRSKCEAKYRRLTPAEREAIKAALPRYVAGTFIDGRYPSRKNPLTWINGRCWLDEAVPIPHNGGGKVIPEQTQPETQDMPMYKAGL